MLQLINHYQDVAAVSQVWAATYAFLGGLMVFTSFKVLVWSFEDHD